MVLVAVHMENETSDVQPKCQGPLQLLSPPFLMTSTTKQMRPNGRGGAGWLGLVELSTQAGYIMRCRRIGVCTNVQYHVLWTLL